MNWLEPLVQNPIAIAISRTLLHSLWQAAIVAIVLAFVVRALRSSDARYAIACGALLALVASLAATFIYVFPEPRFLRAADLTIRPVALAEGVTMSEPPTSGLRMQDVTPWITPLWAMGVLLFSLRQLASWIGARRLRERGVCSPPEFWQDRFDQIRTRLGISHPVALLESCFAQIPVVVGHARPVILLPIGLLTGLPADQVEMILLHELAHIRRRDYLVNIVQTFIEGILFYNPFVWWISKVIKTEREHCCDDMVVSLTNNSHAYATALAALAETRSRPQFVVAASGGNLVQRIRRLLCEQERPSVPVLPLFAIGLLVVGTTIVVAAPPVIVPAPPVLITLPAPIAEGPPTPTPAPSPAPIQTPTRPSVLQRWLEEDVVYIIAEEERRAFESLTSDEEQEKFIEQFWLRRDPTPGTLENEFKDELYSRIAYSNQMFSIPSKAGWKTDRGRILITLGKPDELESHPATATTPAYEIWLYRLVNGQPGRFDFVDGAGSGDFQLTAAPPNRAAMQDERQPVSILGAVNMPGIYRVTGQRFLLDMLALAQGLAPTAGNEIQIVRRKQETNESQTITIEKRQLFAGGRSDLNIQILGNDVINVLHARRRS